MKKTCFQLFRFYLTKTYRGSCYCFLTHPRTSKKIELIKNADIDPGIRFLKPFGFFDYIHLQKNAICTLSDSGTISEESSILNFPAVSIRKSMERPEAQDTGSISLQLVLKLILFCNVSILQLVSKHPEVKNLYRKITIFLIVHGEFLNSSPGILV